MHASLHMHAGALCLCIHGYMHAHIRVCAHARMRVKTTPMYVLHASVHMHVLMFACVCSVSLICCNVNHLLLDASLLLDQQLGPPRMMPPGLMTLVVNEPHGCSTEHV